MSAFESNISSPMVALMRECINTPCRGSDLGANDLITVVRQEFNQSPLSIKRAGLRSSKKSKAVSFEDDATSSSSPSKSARRKRRASRLQNPTPRKPLADIANHENVRPSTAEIQSFDKIKHARLDLSESGNTVKRVAILRSGPARITNSDQELESRLEMMSYEIEEKDQKIAQLTSLVKYLSAEVKIYTSSLERQVEDQKKVIQTLEGRLQNAEFV